jgi:membrane-bound serine protease (ClpP class)
MQTLPVNYAGFLFILLAILFFILEIKVVSYGMLSIAGILCLVLGSLMLFRTPDLSGSLALSVWVPTVLTVSVFFAAVTALAFRAQRTKPQTGIQALEGQMGTVTRAISPDGKVFVNGELWNAFSDEEIPLGEKIVVVSVVNLKLKVKRISVR